MSEKNSMLLPLGIGAGLLLLLVATKKKEATPVAAAIPEDAALPLKNFTTESALPQIDPAPAPSYTQSSASPSEDTDADEEQQSDEGQENESTDDEDEDKDASSDAADNGNFSPYRPSSSINVSKQSTPPPILPNSQRAPTANSASRWRINPNSIRIQSDQAKMLAVQKARNNKGMRFQSDQAKMLAQRARAGSKGAMFVHNGKQRVGAPLPANIRPVAMTSVQQPITITSQPSSPGPAAQGSTIFPLKFGTTSAYVKEVQRKLGVSATGYFGALTKAAMLKRFGVVDISEAIYKQIITGKVPKIVPPAGKQVPKTLRKVKRPMPKKSAIKVQR